MLANLSLIPSGIINDIAGRVKRNTMIAERVFLDLMIRNKRVLAIRASQEPLDQVKTTQRTVESTESPPSSFPFFVVASDALANSNGKLKTRYIANTLGLWQSQAHIPKHR